MIEEISATDLKRRLDAGDDIQLIDVRQPEAVTVLNVPDFVGGDQLGFLQKIRQRVGLFHPDICQRWVRTFLIVWVMPMSIVL